MIYLHTRSCGRQFHLQQTAIGIKVLYCSSLLINSYILTHCVFLINKKAFAMAFRCFSHTSIADGSILLVCYIRVSWHANVNDCRKRLYLTNQKRGRTLHRMVRIYGCYSAFYVVRPFVSTSRTPLAVLLRAHGEFFNHVALHIVGSER